jgi:hypothetical protein
MAITQHTIAAAMAEPGAIMGLNKSSATTEGAATWHSLWKVGVIPAPATANPPAFTAGTGYIPDRTTLGALGQANATAGKQKHLALIQAATSIVGSFIVYDRLWHCSGFDTNVTTLQTVTTPGTLTAGRNPNLGADVEPWVEVYTAPGATGATWTLTGTDSTGTSGRTWTYTHPANAETVGQMAPMLPGTAVGGCRVVESFQCSVASGTASNVGITLLRRLTMIGCPQVNVAVPYDFAAVGMRRIYDDACIAFMVLCSTTGSGAWLGHLGLINITP